MSRALDPLAVCCMVLATSTASLPLSISLTGVAFLAILASTLHRNARQ